jgi:uncharacterized membrane protein YeaQ/YmgE (transglycosylase-associated protein family)
MAIPHARWILPGAVIAGMAAALIHLGWEYSHGGIQRHHLLNDASLPAISNAWGLLVLPLLGVLAGWEATRRTRTHARAWWPAVAGFVGALAAGIALSVAFVTHGEPAATQVMLGVLVASVLFPVYRAEYLFGFVIGMTPVFGSILPALVACVPMLISAVSRLVLWRLVQYTLRRSTAAVAVRRG